MKILVTDHDINLSRPPEIVMVHTDPSAIEANVCRKEQVKKCLEKKPNVCNTDHEQLQHWLAAERNVIARPTICRRLPVAHFEHQTLHSFTLTRRMGACMALFVTAALGVTCTVGVSAR